MTATYNVGAFVRGAPTSLRVLKPHAELFAAYADGVMMERDAIGEAYLSHFVFGPDLQTHYAKHGRSVAGFMGPCCCRHVVLDIDRADLDGALADARRLVAFIHRRYPATEGEVLVYFSGSKGFHILVELAHRPPPAVGFHRTARTFAESLAAGAGVPIDSSLFDLARIVRLPNTRHPTTGLFKRRIDAEALFALDLEGIRKIAAHPAGDGIPSLRSCPALLADDWANAERQTLRQLEGRAEARKDFAADLRAPKWFLDFLRFGVDVGERRPTLFRAAAWLTEQGAPPPLVAAILTEPARDLGLTPKDVDRQIECGIEHARLQAAGGPPANVGDAWEHPADRAGIDPSALAFPPDAGDGPYSATGGRR